MRRLGGYRTVTVSLDPSVTDAAAQRKVISTDLYDYGRTSPSLGDAFLWEGRYGSGCRIKRDSYAQVAKVRLVPPTAGTYTLTVYGYGTSGTLQYNDNAATIQAALIAISASSLSAISVTGTNPFIITVPTASTTIAIATAGTGSSISQGMASIEGARPFELALPSGTEVEILAKYPAHDTESLVGMNRLINQALARLWYPDQLHFTSTDPDNDQVSFEITQAWLKTRSQVIRAYAPTQWEHVFSYTVPVGSHTLTLDVGFEDDLTTGSISGSATASTIESAIESIFASNSVNAAVSVESDSTTRTVTISQSAYADMALTVSTGTAVTTTHEQTEIQRWTDGFRIRFKGQTLYVEWDQPWNRGETWFLEVHRPGHTKVARQTAYQTVGSTWIETMDGLEDDYDQAATDVYECAAVAHYLAARQMALYGPSQETKFWRTEASRAAEIAATMKSLDLPSSADPGFKDEGLSAVRGADSKGYFG
jgi:hypothetical protein